MSLNDLMLNNVMNMKKYKSLKYQGWLEKKSPALLKGWQKRQIIFYYIFRYFMIIDNNGYKLVYFKDEVYINNKYNVLEIIFKTKRCI